MSTTGGEGLMTHVSDERQQPSGSLRMGEPQELAGRWEIATPAGACTVVFAATRMESANGWAIEDATACLKALVPGAVVWRPTPDGVALAGDDRRTLALFAAADGVQAGTATLASGPATLRRAD
jgi:hypothetical protein